VRRLGPMRSQLCASWDSPNTDSAIPGGHDCDLSQPLPRTLGIQHEARQTHPSGRMPQRG
jgi:hypothetical protein